MISCAVYQVALNPAWEAGTTPVEDNFLQWEAGAKTGSAVRLTQWEHLN